MAVPDLRPMGIGDILDATFRLYRRRFLTFLLIALVVYIPYALLMALAAAPQTGAPGVQSVASHLVTLLGLILFFCVLMPLCSAALVHNISASYLGEDISAGQSYSRAAGRLMPLLGTQILAGLVIMLGYVLLIVPGVIFSLWYLVIAPVVVLEGIAGGSALGRSRELMRDNLGKGFVLALVLAVMAWIISYGLAAISARIPWPHPAMGLFVQYVLQGFLLPIQTAPWTLLYYDLRIRKEAFDLEKLAESVAQSATNLPTAR